MNIALLGFGTVGKAFYELTLGRSDLRVTSVLSRRPRPELPCTVTNDFDEIVRDRSVGIVVEVMGGLEPAYRYICAAMRAGKHVVTANKQLVCAHYDELLELARECGVSLRCTAAAGGGIPWLTSLSRAARLDEITAVGGILNGTTNYMLSAMTVSGVDYTTCLREAQALGYAEADPTADVEGYDARRKLVLSANLAFGASVREEEIPCFGISSVEKKDFAAWRELGRVCKLFVRAARHEGRISAFVCPTLPRRVAGRADERHGKPRHPARRALRRAELFRRGRGRLPHRQQRAERLRGRHRGLPELLCLAARGEAHRQFRGDRPLLPAHGQRDRLHRAHHRRRGLCARRARALVRRTGILSKDRGGVKENA